MRKWAITFFARRIIRPAYTLSSVYRDTLFLLGTGTGLLQTDTGCLPEHLAKWHCRMVLAKIQS